MDDHTPAPTPALTAPAVKSPTKVLLFLEELASMPDETIAKVFPASPTMVRMAMAKAGDYVPTDPDELDEMLATVAGWMIALRSDDAATLGATGVANL